MQLTLQLSQDPSEVPANCLTISRKQAVCLFVTSGMSLVKGILGCLFAPGQQHVSLAGSSIVWKTSIMSS